MTFAKRFNIKTSLEEIKEDLTGNVAKEGDTVDALDASAELPVEKEKVGEDAPVESSTEETNTETTVDTPVETPTEPSPEQHVDEPVVDEPVVAEEVEETTTVDEIKECEEQIEVAVEAIAVLGKLSAAIESVVSETVSAESISAISAIAIEEVCDSLEISPESKVYPSLTNITPESVGEFSEKIQASVEALKSHVEKLKVSSESEDVQTPTEVPVESTTEAPTETPVEVPAEEPVKVEAETETPTDKA